VSLLDGTLEQGAGKPLVDAHGIVLGTAKVRQEAEDLTRGFRRKRSVEGGHERRAVVLASHVRPAQTSALRVDPILGQKA
jgi:hypothetical protein